MPKGFEAAFTSMMVEEASRDPRIQGPLEWYMTDKTGLVAGVFIDEVDEAHLLADVARDYCLDPDDMMKATELCEQRIMAQIIGGADA